MSRCLALAVVRAFAVLALALGLDGDPAVGSVGDPHADERLARALTRYRKIAAQGGWAQLPENLALVIGDSGPSVTALRRQLAMTGDLPPPSLLARIFERAPGDVFDRATAAGVRRFQERHGLDPDGQVGPETARALAVPVESRIRQMQRTLARMGAVLPGAWEARAIWVNIPDFSLTAIEGGKERVRMRVVIGTRFDPTPELSAGMTQVVFQPYWNIPEAIATAEVVPRIEGDPSFARDSLEVVERIGDEVRIVDPDSVEWSRFEDLGLELRQPPGPHNPLGRVKFVLPNEFDIYLHDTPADRLFEAERRAFSHGCIRVERPVELCQFVLASLPAWIPDRIHAALSDTATTTVALPSPIPVHLVYWTAWVDRGGAVHFRDDVYGLDQDLAPQARRER